MRYLVDSKTMKQIDEAAQVQTGIPAILLMERAALAIAQAVVEELQDSGCPDGRFAPKVLVVCGTGNNGGDGVAAARILYEWGYPVEICVLGDRSHGSELFERQMQIAENSGIRDVCDGSTGNHRSLCEYSIIVDAIFGIGLTRQVEGIYREYIRMIDESGVPVVAVDMPSGVDADSGRIAGVAVHAARTITFGYDKLGLRLHPGRDYAGRVQVADIGFPAILREETAFPAFAYEREDLIRLPARVEYSNKGTYGKVMIIAGSKDMCGACALSARAAFRAGAGMVKILTVEENLAALHVILPEAIVTAWDPDRIYTEQERTRICRELTWADAVVLGPGLGRSPEAGVLVELLLDVCELPMVIDADALYHLGRNPKYAENSDTEGYRRLRLRENMILTPHLRELADLLVGSVTEIQGDLWGMAQKMAEGILTEKGVLVMKDARTLVAESGRKPVYVNESGNSGMATAGSGDVLTGIIGTLLAQKMDCFEAATMGVYLHGLAGDKVVEKIGKRACMAGDIIEGLTGE